MKKNLLFIAAIFAFTLNFTACATTSSNNQKPIEQPKAAETKPEGKADQIKASEAAKTDTKTEATSKTTVAADKQACLTAKMDGKKLITDQTFVFDFEPFPKSCFVTFANKAEMLDDKDVPRGSTFHIYKDGKIIYDFEDSFDGQAACWVEGVGFEDLNGDGRKEVIIAGSCLGAKDSYPANAVYQNINDDFRTYANQNENLSNLKTVKQIADYVKKNKDKFF